MKAAVFVEPGKMEVREVARPGAVVGRVGVPHTGDINIGDYWMVNLAMAGEPASCKIRDWIRAKIALNKSDTGSHR